MTDPPAWTVADAGGAAIETSPYLNRELSWLDFNARVLAQAADGGVPLLERAKFLAIFSENLDEFFQVRVAGLMDQRAAGLGAVAPDGLTPGEQLQAICGLVGQQVQAQVAIFLEEVVPALADAGIVLSDWASLDDDDREYMDKVFVEQIFPVLTPLAVGPGHPFPYISSLSLNLAVALRNPDGGESRFARVKVPQILQRFVVMPDGERFVPLEQVIAAHLDALFPGIEVVASWAFRVTRNADFALEEEEADDLLTAVELELRRRRFGRAVRLEIEESMPAEIAELLTREHELTATDVYRVAGPLDLGGLWAVHQLDRPALKDDAWIPVTQPALASVEEPVDLFAVLRERDVLVHHPYDSFTTSVGAFVEQAARDPGVLAIKQTLYRTSGDSPNVKALIDAAERGKQVVALVEVKARFDEQANIAWARALEEAGVHVVYGLMGLKTHTKTLLVVRQEDDGIRRYCHIGTGNYNSRTARLYEDVGLLSADPALGADLSDLFNYLTGYSRLVRYRKLLVAPNTLRQGILELIREQRVAPAGSGHIIMKMNSLVDQVMIDALYDASRAGVHVDLIVRGICCLRPGVADLSENIRVRSIVGRYLEHSRIFAFGSRGERRYYIGSADLMPRNLDRRVEAVTPVDDPELQQRLQEVLDANLADDTLAWELGPDAAWRRTTGDTASNTHLALQRRADRTRRRRDAPTLRDPEPKVDGA